MTVFEHLRSWCNCCCWWRRRWCFWNHICNILADAEYNHRVILSVAICVIQRTNYISSLACNCCSWSHWGRVAGSICAWISRVKEKKCGCLMELNGLFKILIIHISQFYGITWAVNKIARRKTTDFEAIF